MSVINLMTMIGGPQIDEAAHDTSSIEPHDTPGPLSGSEHHRRVLTLLLALVNGPAEPQRRLKCRSARNEEPIGPIRRIRPIEIRRNRTDQTDQIGRIRPIGRIGGGADRRVRPIIDPTDPTDPSDQDQSDRTDQTDQNRTGADRSVGSAAALIDE